MLGLGIVEGLTVAFIVKASGKILDEIKKKFDEDFDNNVNNFDLYNIEKIDEIDKRIQIKNKEHCYIISCTGMDDHYFNLLDYETDIDYIPKIIDRQEVHILTIDEKIYIVEAKEV